MKTRRPQSCVKTGGRFFLVHCGAWQNQLAINSLSGSISMLLSFRQ
ncbi:hypothetical protein Z948_2660 [Sulfitobacter donghicola DSW-25 = KCTC 12864 = JCM 14565]|nr:hypothetical protein Z948_2660 [Sulfitobacter donghicola DSW-25 = KCTC 12864 = JCM 14565]